MEPIELDGVTILSSRNYVTLNAFGSLLFFFAICLCFLAIVLIFYGVCIKRDGPTAAERATKLGCSMAGLVILLIVIICLFGSRKAVEYKAIVDDEVPYISFTDAYEVVENEGSIYTIIPKWRK